jgi:hypothetical protein
MTDESGITWREVTQDEFYKGIGNSDVHPQIQPGPYPYTSMFLTRDRRIKGKVVGHFTEGTRLAENKYYLPT